MARSSRPVGVALTAGAVAVLIGCGASTVVPSSASPGSDPLPTTSEAAPPTAADGCLNGTLRVLYPGADNPLRTSCVHAGAQIVITLTAKGAYRWDPVASSNPAVIGRLGSHTSQGGVLVTTLRALRPGTATLTSVDTFTPDPHGPPSQGWSLVVGVTL